jgi:hypothetical protein
MAIKPFDKLRTTLVGRTTLAGKRLSVTIALWLASLLALSLSPAPALAQMERGVMGIFQNGKEVGRIYVPARNAKADTYAEYWFLYPDYVYPGQDRPGLETVIVPLKEDFPSLVEFRKTMKFMPGTRAIQVLSHETGLQLVDDPDEGGQ